MKLNKDNYELAMFNLLEGNLSEVDELLVMDQIEGDEFFFREWKLFKSTVLIADKEVVYTGKSSLLKEEKVAIIPMYTRWVAIAASVCILAVAIVLWPKAKTQTVVDTLEPKENVTPNIKPSIAEVEPLIEEINEDNIKGTELVLPAANVARNVKNQLLPSLETNEFDISEGFVTLEEETLAPEEMNKGLEVARKHLDDKLLKEHKTELIVNTSNKKEDKTEYNVLPPKELDNIESQGAEDAIALEVPKTRRQKIIAFVTNKPLYRITETTAAIYAKVKHPKVRITPDFNSRRPSLNIKLETEGYEAIASLQPFKNKLK